MNLHDYFSQPGVYSSPDGSSRGIFHPHGPRKESGKRLNPIRWSAKRPPLTARLFVGFNVGRKPTWTMDDVVPLVRGFLKARGLPQDSTFVYQRGVYTHEKTGEVITEEGAQILLLNLTDLSETKFLKLSKDLAEHIAAKFRQEEIVVEVGRGGVNLRTWGVGPK